MVVRFPLPCGAPTVLAYSGPGRWGFAVAGGYAYWTTEQSILSVPTTGGATKTVIRVAFAPLDIAVHNGRLYWTDIGGALSTVSVAGAAPRVLASGLGNLGGLAVDDTNVYITEECGQPDASCPSPGLGTTASAGTGRLLSVPLAGGAATTLASQQLNPSSIVIDTGQIYWINAGTSGRDTPNANGSILTMSKSGGLPTVLSAGETAPGSLRLQNTALYWIDASGVSATAIRKLVAGGAASNVGPPSGGPVFVLTVDATTVYWGSLDGILAAPN
jgi:hypothetical protein